MAREYFCAYHSLIESLEPFGDAERGRLFTAMLVYSKSGEELQLSGNERYIWPTLRGMIDRDKWKYAGNCETNRENGKKGGRPPKPNGFQKNRTVFSETEKTQEEEKEEEKDKDKDKGKEEDIKTRKARFTPPTLQDVQDYARQRNSPLDPVRFFEYFDAGNWVDSNGKPVRNWKQKFITWEEHAKRDAGKKSLHNEKTSNPFLAMLMEMEENGE